MALLGVELGTHDVAALDGCSKVHPVMRAKYGIFWILRLYVVRVHEVETDLTLEPIRQRAGACALRHVPTHVRDLQAKVAWQPVRVRFDPAEAPP